MNCNLVVVFEKRNCSVFPLWKLKFLTKTSIDILCMLHKKIEIKDWAVIWTYFVFCFKRKNKLDFHVQQNKINEFLCAYVFSLLNLKRSSFFMLLNWLFYCVEKEIREREMNESLLMLTYKCNWMRIKRNQNRYE